MIVDTKYDDLLLARFLFGKLPNALRAAIDKQKYELHAIAKKTPAGPGAIPFARVVLSVEDHVYEVRFALGKERQDVPQEELVQELTILQIREITELHPIR